jgi:hypothetical protein
MNRRSGCTNIIWALPVSIALWAVILMAVGVWRV